MAAARTWAPEVKVAKRCESLLENIAPPVVA